MEKNSKWLCLASVVYYPLDDDCLVYVNGKEPGLSAAVMGRFAPGIRHPESGFRNP